MSKGQLRDRNYILVDTETTGFDEKKHQLLQVGILVIKGMEVVDTLSVNIKHKEYTITTGAMKANGIDLLEHDQHAYTDKEAGDLILQFLAKHKGENEDEYIVIGQNVQFDIRFLEEFFLKIFKIKEYRKLVSYRSLDIMQVAMTKHLEGKIDLESQSLDAIVEALGVAQIKERHQALPDAILEFEVLKKLLSL